MKAQTQYKPGDLVLCDVLNTPSPRVMLAVVTEKFACSELFWIRIVDSESIRCQDDDRNEGELSITSPSDIRKRVMSNYVRDGINDY